MDQQQELQKSKKRITEQSINIYNNSTDDDVSCPLSKRVRNTEYILPRNDDFEEVMYHARNGDRHTLQNYLNIWQLSSINLRNCDGLTLLMKACQEGRIDCVILFLELGANMSSCYRGDFVALNIACRYGHFDLVKLLISNGAKVNNFSSHTGSALMAACEGGRLEIVLHLLHLGARVNDVGGSFGTALRAACFYGYISIINALILHGADINLTDDCGSTALLVACSSRLLEVVRILIVRKADLTKVDAFGNTALIIACGAGQNGLLKMLLKYEVDVNVAVDIPGFRGSLLGYACYKGSVDTVQLLVEHGALVDATDSRGDTVLMRLCRNGGRADIVQVLLTLHADVHKTDRRGLTPLMLACASGLCCLVAILLDGGSSIDAVDDFGCSALFYAATREVAELLVSRGAGVDVISKYRGSVLYAASVSDKWDIVELLLKRGADHLGNGVSILTWARRSHKLKVPELLLAREVVRQLSSADIARLSENRSYPDITKIMAAKEPIVVDAYKGDAASITYGIVCARISSGDIKSFRGVILKDFVSTTKFSWKSQLDDNALFTAYKEGRVDVIELLLECGSAPTDASAFNTLCPTLLVEACIHGQFEVVKLLLEYGLRANGADQFGRSPLIAACYPSDTEYSKCDYCYKPWKYVPPSTLSSPPFDLVKLLIAHGADVNIKCKYYTPLVAATLAGDIETIKFLLQQGADVGAVSPLYNEPAILSACRQGSVDSVKLLRSYGAELSTKTAQALVIASMDGHLDLVKWLLEFGAKVDAPVKVGQKLSTPLRGACDNGHINIAQHLLTVGAVIQPFLLAELSHKCSLDILKLLVKHGASVNAVCNAGRGPLHIACCHFRVDVVAWLLESGADVNVLDNGGKDALSLVSIGTEWYAPSDVKEAEIFKLLLQYGAGHTTDTTDVLNRAISCAYFEVLDILLSRRAPGSETKTLSGHLYNACSSPLVSTVLLKYGATIAEAEEGRDDRCLRIAVYSNSIEAVTLLLDNGADVNDAGPSLNTPLMCACSEGRLKLARLLLARGADVDAVDGVGDTALLLVCDSGKVEILKMLLTKGADVNKADNEGNTPLIRAAQRGKYNRLAPLLEAGADVTVANNEGVTVLDFLEHNEAMHELCKRYVDKNRVSIQPLLK